MRALTLAAACILTLATSGQTQAQFDLDPLFHSLALADDPVPAAGDALAPPTADEVPEAPDLSEQPLPPVPRVPLPQDLSDQRMLSDDLEPVPTDEGGLYSDSLPDAEPDAQAADAPAATAEQPLPTPFDAAGDAADGGAADAGAADAGAADAGAADAGAADAGAADGAVADEAAIPESIDFQQAFADERLQAAAAAAPPCAAPAHFSDGYRYGGGPSLPPPVTSESYYRTPPCYQNLWDGYAADRQRECHHLHKHLHGRCNCFDTNHHWNGPSLHHTAPCSTGACAPCAADAHSGDQRSWLNRCRDWFSGDDAPAPAAAPHCANTPPAERQR